MTNPFSVRWLAGWTFQTVLMGGTVQVEAHGFGICLRTPVLPGESPVTAADRLVLAPDCGLSQTARWAARRKLEAMCAGVALVRRTL